MCQDKDESEPDNESFLVLCDSSNERSRPLVITLNIVIGSFVIFLFQNIHERTKNLVFVLVDEQAISAKLDPM